MPTTVPGQSGPETLPPFVAESERRPRPQPLPLAPDRRIGLAVVGLGRLAIETILPAIAQTKLCRLAAVMSGERDKGVRVGAAFGVPASSVYGYDDWDRLANDPGVQAVYIVTPNGLHHDQVLQAARIKRHVLCEKPMADSSRKAQEMIAACADAGVKLMIAYRLQYEPNHLEIRRMVRSKAFGELKIIEAHNGQIQDGAGQWRHEGGLAGGGALPDIGIYCLNFARFVTGEEPVEVSAWVWSSDDPRFKEIEENVSWQMRFPSGVVVKASAAYDAHESRRAALYFQKAAVVLDPAFAYHGLRLTVSRRAPDREDAEVVEERVLPEQNQFAAEMDAFARSILLDEPPPTPGEEGLQDHRLMEAIYRSAREGRSVELPKADHDDAFRNPSSE